MSAHGRMPASAWIFPALAALFFAGVSALGFTFTPSGDGSVCGGAAGDPVRHRVRGRPSCRGDRRQIGEPYGTLLLTLAVTVIEVALIATIMLGDKPVPTLARDTVFAVVMIVCNGRVGVCILAGVLRYREQDFQVTGANLYFGGAGGAGDHYAGAAEPHR